jgi:predicted nucleic acid-binding protein
MAQRTECYVDTSALIALRDRSDTYHPVFRRLFSDPPALVTSGLVVAEGHGWFLRRYDQQRAVQLLALIQELPMLRIVDFGSGELPAVDRLVKKFSDHQLTLADAHGLAIISDRGIRTCWSTDWHLSLTGASLVIRSS